MTSVASPILDVGLKSWHDHSVSSEEDEVIHGA